MLEPLKLSAAAEKVSLLALFELAQTGLAIRIAARGRTIFFTTNYSGVRESESRNGLEAMSRMQALRDSLATQITEFWQVVVLLAAENNAAHAVIRVL